MRVDRWLSILTAAFLLLTVGRPAATATMAASSVPPSGAKPAPREADDIRKASEEWARLWSAKRLDPVVALYATDAVFLPSSGGRITGQAAIRDLFEKALATNTPRITVVSVSTERSGNLAYDSGDYLETLTSGGATRELHGSYLAVLRRGGDGRWRIVQHVWTEAPAGK